MSIADAVRGTHAREIVASLGDGATLYEIGMQLDVLPGDLRFPLRRLKESGLIIQRHHPGGAVYEINARYADEYAEICRKMDAMDQLAARAAARLAAQWDVFICHVSEDKDFVGPLAGALRDRGVRVWYDDFEIQPGQSISASIDQGLANSAFGVLVFSPTFLNKGRWSEYEMRGIVTRQIHGEAGILPLYHGVSVEDVRRRSPAVSDLLAISTSVGITEVAEKVTRAIR